MFSIMNGSLSDSARIFCDQSLQLAGEGHVESKLSANYTDHYRSLAFNNRPKIELVLLVSLKGKRFKPF